MRAADGSVVQLFRGGERPIRGAPTPGAAAAVRPGSGARR